MMKLFSNENAYVSKTGMPKEPPSLWLVVWRTESFKKEEMNDYQITEDDG